MENYDIFDILQKNKNNECSICLELMIYENHQDVHLRTLECGHLFHYQCLAKSNALGYYNGNPCPLCRDKSIHCKFQEIYIENAEIFEKNKNYIKIELNACRLTIKKSYAIVSENFKIKKLFQIYSKMMGLSGEILGPEYYPRLYIYDYENVNYHPVFDSENK